MVKQIVALACVLVAGCAPIGQTCGRGRCPDDTECVSIFADFDPDDPEENDSQLDKRVRNLFWCAREQTTCASGTELISPTDWDDVACELAPGESVDIEVAFPRTVPDRETCDPVSVDSAQWNDEIYDTSSGMQVWLETGTSIGCQPGHCEMTGVAGDWIPGVLRLIARGHGYGRYLPPAKLTSHVTTGEERDAFQLSRHLPESRTIHFGFGEFRCSSM